MEEQVVHYFENILDQRKQTRKNFLNTEKKELIKRLQDLEQRSHVVKSLIQEVMGVQHSTSTESSLSSNKILDLLAYENQIILQSIKRVQKQKALAIKQSEQAEQKTNQYISNQQPLKDHYLKIIHELKEQNKQKEREIQATDQINQKLTQKINIANSELKSSRNVNKIQLLKRKKHIIHQIIKEVRQETQEVNQQIQDLTEFYTQIYQTWNYLNSLLAKPKQFKIQIQPPQATADLTRDQFWQIGELDDIQLSDDQIEQSKTSEQNQYQRKLDYWRKEFQKQFIKLQTLKQELNAAKRLNKQLKLDKKNLEKGLIVVTTQKQSLPEPNTHIRSNSNPFDYCLKPAFTKKEADQDSLNFSNLADNSSIDQPNSDESFDNSLLEAFS